MLEIWKNVIVLRAVLVFIFIQKFLILNNSFVLITFSAIKWIHEMNNICYFQTVKIPWELSRCEIINNCENVLLVSLGFFVPLEIFFTYMEPLQLQGKGVKSRPVLGSHDHWTVKAFSVYTETREIRLYGHIWISVTSVVERVTVELSLPVLTT